MYITHLSPDIDFDKYPKENSKGCNFCESKNCPYVSLHNNKIIDTCFMCHCVINHQKDYVFYGFLGRTEMTQLEIIKATWKEFNKKGKIPLPQEIDPEVRLVKIPVYFFSQFTQKPQFSDYCFFFTSKVEDMLRDEFDNVFNPATGRKIDFLKYWDIPRYELTEEENNKIEEQMKRIKKQDFEMMIEKKNILDKRMERVKAK